MSISTIPMACMLALALSNVANAEIYETRDAQGNTVFTDTPTAAGSEAIKLPQTNIADAPPQVPEAPAQPAPKAAPAAATGGNQEGDVVIIGDARNERLEDEIARHRRHEVLDAEKPREVGDGEVDLKRVPPEHVEGEHPVARPHVKVPRR